MSSPPKELPKISTSKPDEGLSHDFYEIAQKQLQATSFMPNLGPSTPITKLLQNEKTVNRNGSGSKELSNSGDHTAENNDVSEAKAAALSNVPTNYSSLKQREIHHQRVYSREENYDDDGYEDKPPKEEYTIQRRRRSRSPSRRKSSVQPSDRFSSRDIRMDAFSEEQVPDISSRKYHTYRVGDFNEQTIYNNQSDREEDSDHLDNQSMYDDEGVDESSMFLPDYPSLYQEVPQRAFKSSKIYQKTERDRLTSPVESIKPLRHPARRLSPFEASQSYRQNARRTSPLGFGSFSPEVEPEEFVYKSPDFVELSVGKGRAPSRYSGSQTKWAVNKKRADKTRVERVTDASLLKRGLKRGQEETVVKRGYGVYDPENVEIVNLKETTDWSFQMIADHLNNKRIQEGRNPSLTVTGVNGRYNRTAPALFESQGKVFVPLSKRRKDNPAASKHGIPKNPDNLNNGSWTPDLDETLVKIVREYDCQKWAFVTQRFEELTGYTVTDDQQLAKRYTLL